MPSFLHAGSEPHPIHMAPIRTQPDFVSKPDGGIWSCREIEAGQSDWLAWCRENYTDHHSVAGRGRNLWRLSLREEPRLYRIGSYDDLVLATEKFPVVKTYSSWTEYGIDFAAMARCYDGLEVTHDGLAEIGYRRYEDCGKREQYNFWGWDVPSVLFFRWLPWSIEQVPNWCNDTADRGRTQGVHA